MINKLTTQKVENIFITVSCIELFMGLLRMCQVTLPFSRYILWIFTLFYAAVAAVRHYSKKAKVVFVILMVFGTFLYINTGLNKGIRAVLYLYALKDVNMRKYYKSVLTVLVVSSIFFAVLSIFGALKTFAVTDIRNTRGGGIMGYDILLDMKALTRQCLWHFSR